MQAYLRTPFWRVSVVRDPTDSYNWVRFEAVGEIPWQIAALIGDTVHNLHSALDMLAYDLVLQSGGVPSNHLYFPIRKTRTDLEKTLKSSELNRAGPEVIDLLLNNVKPYKGGNDALVALHEMDISDKHRLFIPLVTITAVHDFHARDATDHDFRFENVYLPPTGWVNPIAAMAEITIVNPGTPVVGLLFTEGSLPQKQWVHSTLADLSLAVSRVMADFERFP